MVKAGVIRKSNELVEGRYKFSIWEMRIFTKMLMMIGEDARDFQAYRIYLKDIITDFGLNANHSAYEWLEQGALSLMKKVITVVRQVDGVLKRFHTPVIIGVETALEGNSKYVDISFHPEMKPYLLQLRSQFLAYDARNILNLSSVHSIRVYELLKQYEKTGKRRLSVREFKSILGIESKYKLYGHFKDRVIRKAQEDLAEYCDILFEFQEIRQDSRWLTAVL